jgi:hypothetical protein
LFVCVPCLKKKEDKKLNTPRFFGRYTQLERKKNNNSAVPIFFLLSGNVVDVVVVVGQDRKKNPGRAVIS